MQRVIIRELKENDYHEVRMVDELTQRQYHGGAWDKLSEAEKEIYLKSRPLEFKINIETGYCFVGITNEKLVGFILSYETLPFRGTLIIRHIAIHPDYQKLGIGLKLYETLINKAKQTKISKISALINLDNVESLKLHKKIGFQVKTRKQALLEI